MTVPPNAADDLRKFLLLIGFMICGINGLETKILNIISYIKPCYYYVLIVKLF